MMKRREFIAGVGGAVAWPMLARAQQTDSKVFRRIGYIGTNRDVPIGAAIYQGFLDELRSLGFKVGQNVGIEFRPLEQDLRALSNDAAELVRLKVDVIVTDGTENALQAAVSANSKLPIVMIATNFDPIARGYVKSLRQPGGNITGLFLRQPELAEKQTELLSQAVPGRIRLSLLYDVISADQMDAAAKRAKALNLELNAFKLDNPPYDFDLAFRKLADADPQMLLVQSSPHFAPARKQIAELAIRYRWPTMFIFKSYVEAGGLLAYGADYVAMHRQAAICVAKIFAGTKPEDIPIEQPNKFEFVINLKTAKEIKVELPTSILLRADQVIE